ncbi:MAG: universal stress protein [Desulfatirhabdiaceae bacterium]
MSCEQICADFFGHVLFTTDFSETAEHAFDYVEKIIQKGGLRITLLHIQNRTKIEAHLQDRLEKFKRHDRVRLELMARRLEDIGKADVDVELRYGFPKQEIIQFVEQNGYTLIVMGTHGRGYFGKLFMGSVAYHVARNTAVPTLLIPPIR